MAHKKYLVGILAMVLVFGMSVVGCSDGNDNGGGINANVFAGIWTGTFEDEYDLSIVATTLE